MGQHDPCDPSQKVTHSTYRPTDPLYPLTHRPIAGSVCRQHRYKTFIIDGRSLWDDAIKFARWQHHLATDAVPRNTC